MSKIRVLPEQLANRIAAGEVVERPASVVKELLENSLDAGADRIEVEIEGGGTRLIRVIDNGEGMDEDDVLLCLERHGTSKIKDDKDLEAINSLGFRGEAIPSISSVSRMTIISRQRSADLGTTAILNYGKLHKIHETGCRRGTTFEIRNLFGNTPARKKFLRTNRTEIGHIDELVKNYALAAPEVSFLLRIDGRQTLHMDSGQDLPQRLASVLHYTGDFVTISHTEPGGALPKITGYLVPPDHPLKGSARIKLLVNGRSVKDRMPAHGVIEGLRGFLMKGHNPAGLLHLHLSPAEVDVNVHPTKQEVRFRRSRDIHQLIVQAIQQGMHGYQQTLKQSFFSVQSSGSGTLKTDQWQPTAVSPTNQGETPRPNANPQVSQPATAEPIPVPCSQKYDPPRLRPAFIEPEKKGHGLKIIGQYDNLYIFCQSSDGLLVIDQHAAHERLLFEKLKEQFLKGSITRQNLLFPETVELSLADVQKVEQYGDEIDTMGFSLREFGGNAFVLSAVPALGSRLPPVELFLDILEQFDSSNSSKRKGSLLEDILASMACK
ncbi:MAG: DNA mismatch repair endonuclease MutL, partial [Desulfocapsa sp.]|nr:DNA mismatch repair endonuclease MutL [Desulfocapsa sp.]